MSNWQALPWTDPLELAARIDEPYWVLLYSGVQAGYSGRYSYLAHRLSRRIEGEHFSDFENALSSSPCPNDRWFGYFGYGLKHDLEQLPHDPPGWLAMPALCMMRFDRLYRFDHENKTLSLSAKAGSAASADRARIAPPSKVLSLASNMNREAYLEKVASILRHIRAGDLYQANLTRKFFGEFETPPDDFALFAALCRASPAPYSAFMRLGETSLLSSSPELFLRLAADGHMSARPIKGSAPRFADPGRDAASRQALCESAKDRAENLMIADLMRNDLSRSAVPGSVRAGQLFEVTTHATIHHMSSTVTGQRRPEIPAFESVRRCFPPASMTGAPKIAAMRLISELEPQARGVYSGALGWLGGSEGELSVVIRTLLLRGNRFEFQVGGGIVADSLPQHELTETFEKAKGIASTLHIPMEWLERL